MKLRHKYEGEFAKNPSYIEMYRRGNAYHGAHPFFMWYWGENGRQHIGKVIAAGAQNAHVPQILGWDRAESLPEAIAMAKSFVGPFARDHDDAPPAHRDGRDGVEGEGVSPLAGSPLLTTIPGAKVKTAIGAARAEASADLQRH